MGLQRIRYVQIRKSDVCRICDKQLAPNSELISFCDCLRRGVVYAMMKKTPSVSEASWFEKPLIRCQWSRAIPVAGTVLHGRDDVDASPASCVRRVSLRCVTVILFLATICLRADQVEMQNGDRYVGTVLSLDTNTLVLRSAVLGTVTLPRGKVALIHLGSGGATNFARATSATKRQPTASSIAITNGMTDLSASLRQLGANTNFIEQVRAQFLADAGPEANNKFNGMVSGLLSGRLTVNDIRAEAKSAADQLKELKRDLGEDAGGALDGYLAILENFLRETAPPLSVSTTNVSRSLPKVNSPLKR